MRLKGLFFYLIATSALFVSCGEDNLKNGPDTDDTRIWDFANFSVVFSLTDQDGHDLLDSTSVNNILADSSKWSVTYADKTYKLLPQNYIETKFNMPIPLGLRLEPYGRYTETGFQHEMYSLTFGEFSPTSDYKDERFTIHWDENTQSDIDFDLYITWNKGDPTVHRAIKVNGASQQGEWPIIKIVLDK